MAKVRAPQHDAAGRRSSASQKRRHDILLAGKKVFLKQGYHLASIDRVAAAAGTTKRTVYDHFGSKDGLLAEVVALASRQFANSLPAANALPKEPEKGLRTFVAGVRKLVSRPETVLFHRLVIEEAERRPELARTLYETAFDGPERVLTTYLESCVTQRRLKPHDVAVSARIILDVAAGNPRIRGLSGLQNAIDDRLGLRASEHVMNMVAGALPLPRPSVQREGE
jgi:TetR/AcrR family transcriptional regulator, mexJK operon transcriptional repressor